MRLLKKIEVRSYDEIEHISMVRSIDCTICTVHACNQIFVKVNYVNTRV